jgi:hypothetical protein
MRGGSLCPAISSGRSWVGMFAERSVPTPPAACCATLPSAPYSRLLPLRACISLPSVCPSLPFLRAACPRQNAEKCREMLRSQKISAGPTTCELLLRRSRRIFVCGGWFRLGGVTMCKTHLDKTLDPAPFLASSAPSLGAFGVRYTVGPYRVLLRLAPVLSALCPAFTGLARTLAVGGLPTVKDLPVPSSMAARSPSRDPSTKPPASKHLLYL